MKTFNEFIAEDGMAAGTGAAPTNTTSGLASEKAAPVSRKTQRKIQKDNTNSKYRDDQMRKVVDTAYV